MLKKIFCNTLKNKIITEKYKTSENNYTSIFYFNKKEQKNINNSIFKIISFSRFFGSKKHFG